MTKRTLVLSAQVAAQLRHLQQLGDAAAVDALLAAIAAAAPRVDAPSKAA